MHAPFVLLFAHSFIHFFSIEIPFIVCGFLSHTVLLYHFRWTCNITAALAYLRVTQCCARLCMCTCVASGEVYPVTKETVSIHHRVILPVNCYCRIANHLLSFPSLVLSLCGGYSWCVHVQLTIITQISDGKQHSKWKIPRIAEDIPWGSLYSQWRRWHTYWHALYSPSRVDDLVHLHGEEL